MARSIGKRNIDKLKRIVAEEYARKDLFGQPPSGKALHYAIGERVPVEWFDIWESAWAEIERIIYDEISALTYRR